MKVKKEYEPTAEEPEAIGKIVDEVWSIALNPWESGFNPRSPDVNDDRIGVVYWRWRQKLGTEAYKAVCTAGLSKEAALEAGNAVARKAIALTHEKLGALPKMKQAEILAERFISASYDSLSGHWTSGDEGEALVYEYSRATDHDVWNQAIWILLGRVRLYLFSKSGIPETTDEQSRLDARHNLLEVASFIERFFGDFAGDEVIAEHFLRMRRWIQKRSEDYPKEDGGPYRNVWGLVLKYEAIRRDGISEKL